MVSGWQTEAAEVVKRQLCISCIFVIRGLQNSFEKCCKDPNRHSHINYTINHINNTSSFILFNCSFLLFQCSKIMLILKRSMCSPKIIDFCRQLNNNALKAVKII